MIVKIRSRIIYFFEKEKLNPTISAVSAGLYPILYYYNSNFTLVNSWEQLFMFLLTFILIPVGVFNLLARFSKKYLSVKQYEYVVPILNICLFIFLITLSIYGLKLKILLIAIILALFIAILIKKHFEKIVMLQLIMALIVLPMLLPDINKQFNCNNEWAIQPDSIINVEFKRKPNIYIIQPDGYPNFSELERGYYQYNNSEFEVFLKDKKFKLYNNFRSNYFSTLSSNSSMFCMKHHYYNNTNGNYNNTNSSYKELYNARDIIVGENPVVKVFKQNGYKTNLLLEKSYLLLNRPEMGYDYCNIELGEVSFLGKGFEMNKDILRDFKECIINNSQPNFFFIEKLQPGHISTYKSYSSGRDIERVNYLNQLEKSNRWLKEIIEEIEDQDKNGIIVIIADHGGFVGFDYTMECKIKQTDRDLIYSIFSTALAIKWGKETLQKYDDQLKTNVNLFRVLFAYLSEDDKLLHNLQPDKSFTVIEKGAPSGIYEYINEKGEVVFNKVSN